MDDRHTPPGPDTSENRPQGGARSRRGPAVALFALLLSLVWLLADAIPRPHGATAPAPWGPSAARADCLAGVPAPSFFSASLVTNFPAGNEFQGQIRLGGFTDDFAGFFTPLPTFPGPDDDRGVDGLEIEVRDVTANGAFRLLRREYFGRFDILSYTADVVMTESPDTPDPASLYLGRTYAFRMRAVALGLGTNGARDAAVPPFCTFPWSAEARVTTPSEGLPGIDVGSSSLDFGDVELGFSAERTLRVRNGEASAMTVKVSRAKPPFAHDATTLVLEPGESADVRVTFTPDKEGPVARELRLTGPKGVATVVVPMSGRGTPATPRLSFDVAKVDFGRIRGSAKQMLAVTNRTDVALDVVVTAPRAPFYRLTPGTLSLPPRGTSFVEFEFIPREAKVTFDGSVRFSVLNLRESPKQTVPLTGGILDTLVVKSKSTAGGSGVEYRILPGDWTELNAGQELPPGAEVRCDPDASVAMELPDGSVVDMGPGTGIRLSAFFRKGGRVEAEILATVGSIVSRIPRHDVVRSDFKIRSPTATASVRGTAFTTTIDPATGDTTYAVTEGTVAVKPSARGAKLVLVKAGFQVTVTKAGAGPVTPIVP